MTNDWFFSNCLSTFLFGLQAFFLNYVCACVCLDIHTHIYSTYTQTYIYIQIYSDTHMYITMPHILLQSFYLEQIRGLLIPTLVHKDEKHFNPDSFRKSIVTV